MAVVDTHSTLLTALTARAAAQPERQAYALTSDGHRADETLTFAELDKRARAIAGFLQSIGAEGQRAVLLYPPGLAYVAAFWGCLYANVVAVPAYPPDPRRLERSLPRLESVVRNADADLVLTTQLGLASCEQLFALSPLFATKQWVATETLDPGLDRLWSAPALRPDSVALLQYTSGSTGAPKGVVVTHRHLLENCASLAAHGELDQDTRFACWLPLFHDLGLISGVVLPAVIGSSAILISHMSFVARPRVWLETISSFRATVSGGPNFGFQLTAQRAGGELDGLDLSCWRIAFTAAEPVRPHTLELFSQTFAACGFRREAFVPCYGLAEATCAVASEVRDTGPQIESFAIAPLERGRALVARADEPSRALVSCGRALPGGWELEIVEAETGRRCSPGELGELWVRGPSVGHGYWRREEETAQCFGGRLEAGPEAGEPYLQTGDLAFLHDGALYIAGRIKDLIIIRGRNLYPQDIERAVEESHPALRKGSCAAFSVEVEDEERVAVVVELSLRRLPLYAPGSEAGAKRGAPSQAQLESVLEGIREAVSLEFDVRPAMIALLGPGKVHKTSSGKIARRACREALLEGSLEPLAALESAAASAHSEVLPPPPASLTSEADLPELTAFVCAVVAQNLGQVHASVAPDASLDELGVDSVGRIVTRQVLEEELGRELPLSLFLAGGSLTALADEILGLALGREPRAGQGARSMRGVDFLAEAALPEALTPVSTLEAPPAQPRHYFVTGATGFVGSHLLAALLRDTDARFDCLVRGKDRATARARLEQTLAAYGLLDRAAMERVEVLTGDLAREHLGLGPAGFDALARRSDAIVHAGGWVNWIYPYRALKPANVQGTEWVIRLATEHRLKPLHHVSTMGVLVPAGDELGRSILEDDPLGSCAQLPTGYDQSKWVAEALVHEARKRGVPAAIYRPGMLTGNAQTGRYDKSDDFAASFLKGCVQLGAIPALDTTLDIAPIDYAVDAITWMITRGGGLGHTFNMTDPGRIRMPAAIAALREYGYELEELGWDAWKERLYGLGRELRANVLYPFLGFIGPLGAADVTMAEIGDHNLRRALEGSGVACPPMSDVIPRYLAHFVERGELASPPHGVAPSRN